MVADNSVSSLSFRSISGDKLIKDKFTYSGLQVFQLNYEFHEIVGMEIITCPSLPHRNGIVAFYVKLQEKNHQFCQYIAQYEI